MDDWTLLRTYASEGSEEAFAQLVARHVTMVYSVALRRAARQPDLAEEITQRTFCLLAKKAASLPERGLLVGWLYRAACNLSRETLRTEMRRRVREENAARMRSLHSDPEADSPWDDVSPLLDEVIETLPEPERLAIVLRFFQGKPMRDVGLAFGVSEEAARMRVSRAVEKLRILFTQRGIKVASLTLAGWLTERSNSAIPAELIPILRKIPSQPFPLAASGSFIANTLFFMAKFNLQKTAALALLGLAGLTLGVGVYQMHKPHQRPFAAAETRNQPIHSKALQSLKSPNPTNSPVSLESAIENLKWALTAPWPESRKPPIDRVAEALKLFGDNRAAAVPVLMFELNKPRGKRSINIVDLSVEGLALLGVDAASAVPDLAKLTAAGDLLFLNDTIPRLFLSVDPSGSSIPKLIEGLTTPGALYSHFVQSTISQLILENPGSENIYHPLLAKLLDDPKLEIRQHASFLLARMPGEIDTATLPILVDALKLAPLHDPKAYDPIVDDWTSTTITRDGERGHDEELRYEAANALQVLGPKANSALPSLLEAAQLLLPLNWSRPYVLEAIGSIDPAYRAESPEVDQQLTLTERGRELTELAKGRSASFDELLEGLENPSSVHFAAEALADLGEDARPALPQLLKALDQSNDYSVAQRIKDLDPNLLVEELRQKHLGGLNAMTQILGEMGSTMTSALPAMNSILNDMKPGDLNLFYVAEAIQKIDPDHPQMVSYDLQDATDALLKEIYDNDKYKSPVYNAYVNDFQNLNNVARPQLLKFVEATKADPDLHRIFVTKLLEKNPMLAGQIN